MLGAAKGDNKLTQQWLKALKLCLRQKSLFPRQAVKVEEPHPGLVEQGLDCQIHLSIYEYVVDCVRKNRQRAITFMTGDIYH